MRVFVAGGTGVVGWRAVAALARSGHAVSAVVRTKEKATMLRELGAHVVFVDLFDPAAVRQAVDGHDVVLNLATHIPAGIRGLLINSWMENDRVRREVSRNLVDAALATNTQRYIQESIALMYEDRAAEWIDETGGVKTSIHTRSMLEAEAQAARFAAAGRTAVVLRFGLFYGPDSAHTKEMVLLVRKGIAPLFGAPHAFVSSIATDDAASACVAALTAPGGTYNITDDEPLPRSHYFYYLAATLQTRMPVLLPPWMGKISGPIGASLTRSLRVSNRAFRAATAWRPQFPSVREGWGWAVGGSRGKANG